MDEFYALQPQQKTSLQVASQIADEVVARTVFEQYRRGIAEHTVRRQNTDLALLACYLQRAGISGLGSFCTEAEAWRHISGGLVQGFREWMLQEGFAIGSVNVRLSTVKRYAGLAYEAGTLSAEQFLKIRQVKLLRYTEGINIDKGRETVRVGTKKSTATVLTSTQAHLLKQQPNGAQGRRDRVLVCLLLDHGLRCGEIALLQVEHVNLEENVFQFERPKVHKKQKHELTSDTRKALQDYFEHDRPTGYLLQASRKNEKLIGGRMSERAITARIRLLGEAIGVRKLSAHDCRHYWATTAAKNNTDAKSLQTAGGWNSPVMPLRYIAESEIANKGVKLT